MKIYWVATYGNMGLEVEHFTSSRKYIKAVREATEDHASDRLDSFTHGEKVIEAITKIEVR